VKDHYLINDQVTFCFDLEERYIECNGLKEILQLKEAQILKYMIDNDKGETVSSKLILDDNWAYWSDKRVLHKVFSNLRKKFKIVGLSENGFVAIGSEYQFNYNCQLIEVSQIKPSHKPSLHSKTTVFITFVLSLLLLLTLIINFAFNIDDSQLITIDSLILTTPIKGVSTDPSLSPDGRRLAFTYRKGSPDDGSQIVLSTDNNNKFSVLTQNHNDQTPSWSPSGKKIVFQRRSSESCEILLINLDDNYMKEGEIESLADCNKFTVMTSFTWKSEHELFFTKRNKLFGPYVIFKMNLKDKSTSAYFSYDEKKYSGVGHYFIHYSSFHQALFSLSSEDRRRSSFNKIGKKNDLSIIKIFDDALWGIGFIKEKVVFIDLDNQLKSFSMKNPSQLTTILKNPLKKIAYPVISENNQRISMISGNTYRHNLQKMNLETLEISEVFSSQSLLTSPKLVGNNIYYQSAESGVHQLFLHNESINYQITSFTHNREINYFVVSDDEQWLAIDFMDGTEIFQLDENGLTFKTSFSNMHNPAFSKNNKRILLSTQITSDKKNVEQSTITEYYLSNAEKTGISIKNGYFGMYHNKGIIFVSTDKTIKLFKLHNITLISSNNGGITPNSFAVNDKSIFVSAPNKMTKIEIEGGQKTELPAPLRGEVTVNNSTIYFRKQVVGSTMIYTSNITQTHK
jgi:Tol biopolymer transport system component